MALPRLAVWLLAGGLLLTLLGRAAQGATDDAAAVHLVRIDNQIINPVTAEYLIAAMDRAEAARAQCLIIELDTPGGLLESTRTIVKRMFSAEVPLVVYVAPSGARAGSAGVFLTLASHVAVMAPTTTIGAAHPVTVEGGGPIKKLIRRFKDEQGKESSPPSSPLSPPKKPLAEKQRPTEVEEVTEVDPMSEKILHDTVAWVSAIAQARGRNVAWARQSVEASVSSTEAEALAAHVVDLVARNIPELLTQLEGRTVQLPHGPVTLHTQDAQIERRDMTQRQRLLLVITNPTVAYLLMMLGFWGLFTEITHPGLGFPGIAGAMCLILALFAFQTLPINYAGVTLILLGLALLIAEVKVVSYGLLTVGGLTCLTLGSLMLIDSPYAFLRVSLYVILPIVIATAGIALFLVGAVVRTHRRQVTTGAEGLVGAVGVAQTDLQPAGHVFLHGESWQAVAPQLVPKGRKVRVVRVEGLTLMVEGM